MDSESHERAHVERMAVALFGIAAIVMATVCGAIIVSGWFAGVIQDEYERFFWAGAILAGLAVTVLGLAALPGSTDDRRAIAWTRALTRIGLVMFLIAPALCIGALVADFYL